jgi:hypothetical protein
MKTFVVIYGIYQGPAARSTPFPPRLHCNNARTLTTVRRRQSLTVHRIAFAATPSTPFACSAVPEPDHSALLLRPPGRLECLQGAQSGRDPRCRFHAPINQPSSSARKATRDTRSDDRSDEHQLVVPAFPTSSSPPLPLARAKGAASRAWAYTEKIRLVPNGGKAPVRSGFFHINEPNTPSGTLSTTSGTDWASGAPDSNGQFGGSVTEGNGGSTNCWGTNLGDFNGGTADRGYYADPTVTCLRSPIIDLTNIAGAQLTFAEALDLEQDQTGDTPGVVDTAVVNIIESASDTIIATAIYSATDGDETSADWAPANGGTPIDLTPYVGQAIRIEWCLDGKGGSSDDYMGWYIDDVTVTPTVP